MQLYYAPLILENPELPLEEAKHCMKIMRNKPGNIIEVTDGKGSFYKCEIIDSNASLKILESFIGNNNRPYTLHLAVAPLKNNERTDWMIEKAVEFGVDEITFIGCENNERNKINMERCNRVAIAAMKQSLKASLVKINELIPWTQFAPNKMELVKLIAHCNNTLERTDFRNIPDKGEYLICTGPEGDFTKNEILMAYDYGFSGIILGANRLRSETATIAICSFLYLKASVTKKDLRR